MKTAIFAFLFLGLSVSILAQNDAGTSRITDKNGICWMTYVGTHRFAKQFEFYTELSLRRGDGLQKNQQTILRLGGNWRPVPNLLFHLGYANARFGNIGDYPEYPVNGGLKENRVYEQVNYRTMIDFLEIQHRFRLEQRWMQETPAYGKGNSPDGFYQNRARYMFRLNCPTAGKTIDDGEFYVSVWDEFMLNFGPNVESNFFDQNRLGLLVGYRFHKDFMIEAGYINQLLEQGTLVQNKPVYQINQGLITSVTYNFDFRD